MEKFEDNKDIKDTSSSSNVESITSQSPHFTDYEESLMIGKQQLGSSLMPIYTLDWVSRSGSYFLPATGLDLLLGVPEVLLLQTMEDDTFTKVIESDFKFLVKIPKKETLYMGIENSSAIQRTFFGSQRNFYMTLLDPIKHEVATFTRRGAFMNAGNCFRQELVISVKENFPIGRIIQNNTLQVSFTIHDEKDEVLYKIIASQKPCFGSLNQDVHFSILDPKHRTGGVILHKWDDDFKGFLYHIVFPSCNTDLNHKMLLIGTALLIEYTYFIKNGCFCFT